MLGCSEWWVKEQARKRRIPFSWIGVSYRFTSAHVAEIIAAFEVRPVGGPSKSQGAVGTVARRRPVASSVEPVVQLRVRVPQRRRSTGGESPAA
jgi:hypothetical protein